MSTWMFDEYAEFVKCHDRSIDTVTFVSKKHVAVVSTTPVRKNDPCQVFVNNTLVYENRFTTSECQRIADMFVRYIHKSA